MVTRRVSERACIASLEQMSINSAAFSVDWIFTIFTSRMHAGNVLVIRLLRGDFEVFHPVVSIRCIDGGEISCPISAGVGWGPGLPRLILQNFGIWCFLHDFFTKFSAFMGSSLLG